MRAIHSTTSCISMVFLPNINLVSKFKNMFPSGKQLTKNIHKVAFPAIYLISFAMFETVEAIGYVECINHCDKHRDAHPLSTLICYAMCHFFSEKDK